jgi:hypothetical protein
MNPANSDRYKREAVWTERWFPDAHTAKLVAANNLGSLIEYDPMQSQQNTPVDVIASAFSDSDFERPGMSAVPLSIVSLSQKKEREWLFRCDSTSPLDLLHPGEIEFLVRYAAKVFKPSLHLDTKESFIME